jgi:hypothetical protein
LPDDFDVDQFSDDVNNGFFDYSESLKILQKDLLGDYKSSGQPSTLFNKTGLTNAIIASLKHYVACKNLKEQY